MIARNGVRRHRSGICNYKVGKPIGNSIKNKPYSVPVLVRTECTTRCDNHSPKCQTSRYRAQKIRQRQKSMQDVGAQPRRQLDEAPLRPNKIPNLEPARASRIPAARMNANIFSFDATYATTRHLDTKQFDAPSTPSEFVCQQRYLLFGTANSH
jgi:hypothetical protein